MSRERDAGKRETARERRERERRWGELRKWLRGAYRAGEPGRDAVPERHRRFEIVRGMVAELEALELTNACRAMAADLPGPIDRGYDGSDFRRLCLGRPDFARVGAFVDLLRRDLAGARLKPAGTRLRGLIGGVPAADSRPEPDGEGRRWCVFLTQRPAPEPALPPLGTLYVPDLETCLAPEIGAAAVWPERLRWGYAPAVRGIDEDLCFLLEGRADSEGGEPDWALHAAGSVLLA